MARPNLSYLKNLILVFVGIPCGFLTGLTGASLTSVVAPLIRYLLGLREQRASATGLITGLVATAACLLAYGQHNALPWTLGFCSMVGQLVGAFLGNRVSPRQSEGGLIKYPLAAAGGALGIAMMASGRPVALLHYHGGHLILAALAAGVAVGLLERFFKAGGVLTVPAAIYILGLPVLAAQGIAIIVLLLVSLPTATLLLARPQVLETRSATWVPFGAVFGALIGAYYATSRLSPHGLIEVDGLITALLALWSAFYRKPDVQSLAQTGETT